MAVYKKIQTRARGFNHDLLPSYFAEFIFRRKYLKQQSDPFLTFIKEGICILCSLQRAIPNIEREQDKNKIKGEQKALENSRKRAAQADKENSAPASVVVPASTIATGASAQKNRQLTL